MKNAWRGTIVDRATWNANLIEEIPEEEWLVYRDMCEGDIENADLDED
jgi:hypothetical protein